MVVVAGRVAHEDDGVRDHALAVLSTSRSLVKLVTRCLDKYDKFQLGLEALPQDFWLSDTLVGECPRDLATGALSCLRQRAQRCSQYI